MKSRRELENASSDKTIKRIVEDDTSHSIASFLLSLLGPQVFCTVLARVLNGKYFYVDD